MRVCSVCKKKFYKGDGTLFHVPKDVREREKWSEICGTNFTVTSLICTEHFLPSSIVHAGNRIFLIPDAEPFVNQLEEIEMVNTDNQCLYQTDEAYMSTGTDVWVRNEPIEQHCKEQGTQTDLSFYEIDGRDFGRIRALKAEITELKLKLAQANSIVDGVNKIFTERQLRKIISPRAIHSKWKDIASITRSHASGPKAYNRLYKRGKNVEISKS